MLKCLSVSVHSGTMRVPVGVRAGNKPKRESDLASPYFDTSFDLAFPSFLMDTTRVSPDVVSTRLSKEFDLSDFGKVRRTSPPAHTHPDPFIGWGRADLPYVGIWRRQQGDMSSIEHRSTQAFETCLCRRRSTRPKTPMFCYLVVPACALDWSTVVPDTWIR